MRITRIERFTFSRIAWAAGAMVLALALGASPAMAAPGEIVRNGQSSGIAVPNGFLFEPEVPFASLKHVPTWSELEQMLDNPYAVANDPATPGNDQGYPSYLSNITRRRGFGVLLPQFHVHPLNYNTTTGEEMRLVNFGYPGGSFDVIDQLVEGPTGTFTWTRTSADIAAGELRVEPGSIPIDYNNPIAPDLVQCVVTVELNPPEGSLLCGGDPGEPGPTAFSVFSAAGYSTPAIRNVANEGTFISTPGVGNHRLYDPTPDAVTGVPRGFINARNPGTGAGGLRKPSLRIPANGGSPNNPNYVLNAVPAGTLVKDLNVTASNENDFIRNASVAAALGKALFWDMQVGSDGVQSCGSCHFNGTGTDTRLKNQLNPNHIGGDNTLQIGGADLDPLNPAAGKAANYTLQASDFPLHKLANENIAGDPLCTTPMRASVSTIPYAGTPGGLVIPAGYQASQRFSNPVTGTVTVCDRNNTLNDVNDVVSSMGVHWGIFKDVSPIGTLIPDPSGVSVVAPDLRETAADCATLGVGSVAEANCLAAISDPIAAFRGAAGTGELGVFNEFRRVEPRNTPTMQAAGFNFDNFWDGRARHDFNGGSVFGAADPQTHVYVNDPPNLVPTRQIIRFTSIASLATGPGLSEFEMSFAGRNWAKNGKKLLQAGATPLANQLVSPTDSLLGPYSNQPGNPAPSPLCSPAALAARAAGKPGLCLSYNALIQAAYYPRLWQNTSSHLVGCYTDGRTEIHPNQCAAGSVAVPVLVESPTTPAAVIDSAADPFDNYVLSVVPGAAATSDTNQFTQMEGNFSLFWGLSIQSWVNLLVPDNTPFDQFLDVNPDAFKALGEPGEAGLVPDLLDCTSATQRNCFRPVGNFKRDDGLAALQNPTGEGGAGGTLVTVSGTRNPATDPDPLLGLDIFFASNLSLKNPNFRTGRCGECHAIPTLTDHTMPFTSKINLMDAVAEFATPGVELIVEPLARLRVITGFLLESEINENGQDAVERRIVDQSLVPNPVDGLAYPGATPEGLPWFPAATFGGWTGADSAFLDNGMYNLGIRPTSEDLGRGGRDAFGWPLSLATLMMKNLAGEDFNPGGDSSANGFAQPAAPGIPIPTFDPSQGNTGGLFEESAQDQQINPGFEGEPAIPLLPAYLGDFANNITVGDFPPEVDEAGGAIGGMVNTLTDAAMIEGFMDTLGPFNPANVAAEVLNFGGHSTRPGDNANLMGTWPNANRVGRMGAFKAAPLRSVELTGPYFHNGGKLTLRQVVDFYTRGGDFPITNKAHRDFNLVNMNIEIQSNLNEDEKVALVDFLLELTDERNRFDRAPFDKPEVIIPVDGLAPDNALGRSNLLSLTGAAPCIPAHVDPANPAVVIPASGGCFQSVPEVGAAGSATPEPLFMNLTKVRVKGAAANPGSPECDYTGALHGGVPRVSQYCH